MKTTYGLACLALTASAVLAPPAWADDQAYLEVLRDEYWTHSFTDSQLLAEGYKVCDMNTTYGDGALFNMVRSDLGISDTAAADLVGAAEGGLGC